MSKQRKIWVRKWWYLLLTVCFKTTKVISSEVFKLCFEPLFLVAKLQLKVDVNIAFNLCWYHNIRFECQDYFSLIFNMVLWLIRQKLPWHYLARFFLIPTGLPWDASAYFINFLSALSRRYQSASWSSPSEKAQVSPETWTMSLPHLSHMQGCTCLQVNKCMHLNSQKKLHLPDTIWVLISFTLFVDKATQNLYIPNTDFGRKCQNKAVFIWNLAIYEIFCSYEFSSSMCVFVLKTDFVSSDVWTDI